MLTFYQIEYTVNLLLVNLAIVESPTSATVAIYKPVSEDPDAPLEKKDETDIYDVEIETATVSGRPITHSIKKTIMHLQSIGGFKARWRGLRIYIAYSAFTALIHLFFSILPIPAAPFFGTLAAAVGGARLHCAWTHATITMPSEKQCIRKELVPKRMIRYLAGPNLLKTLATEASVVLTILSACLSVNQSRDLVDAKSEAVALYLFWGALPILTAFASFFLLVVPANIILVRREASMLAEEKETVVPMDRTFGGRLFKVGEVLSMNDALKSFTCESWRRLVKLYVKFFFISLALVIFGFQLFALEVWVIMGDNLMVLITAGRAQLMLATGA